MNWRSLVFRGLMLALLFCFRLIRALVAAIARYAICLFLACFELFSLLSRNAGCRESIERCSQQDYK